MRFLSWLDGLKPDSSRWRTKCGQSRSPRRKPARCKLSVETLEDRCLLSFNLAGSYYVGDYPIFMATADFNGDGRLDLAFANHNGLTVSVLLGNADGTFQPARYTPPGLNPYSLAVGDFNADGKLDLVRADPFSLSVLLGNGDGTFQPSQKTTLGFHANSMAVGDLNADGKLDLMATSNQYTPTGVVIPGGSVNVLLGRGDGTFAAPTAQVVSDSYLISALLQDFNADGKLDLATTDYYHGVHVLAGNGNGTFGAPADYTTGSGPRAIVVGDVNRDGISDLVTRNASTLSVLLGNGSAGVGDGTFQPAQNSALNFYPASLALGDFNADGKLDLVATSSEYTPGDYYYPGTYTGDVNVLVGHGDGTFAMLGTSRVENSYPVSVAAADFNGDGFLDVAAMNPGFNDVAVLLNTGEWRSFLVSGFPSSTTAGDAHTITVTATDTAGNPMTNYTGTVRFSSSDPQAVLPADYTFTTGVGGDNGTHTFTVTLKTAATQSLAVADTTAAEFSGNQTGIVVNPAAMSSLVVVGFPSPSTSGAPGYFNVIAADAYGNGATGTVHLTSSDAAAILPADYTFTASDYGVAYIGATLATVGTQSITVTDTTNSSVTSTQAGIRVVPLASITGPYAALLNQTLTFTLGASGMPPGTVFTYAIDWNGDGVVDQIVSGPSGTSVNHSYPASGWYPVGVTATLHIGAEDYTSYKAYQSVSIFAVTVTVQADPGDATKSALVVAGTAGTDDLRLSPATGNAIALSISGYSIGSYSAPGGAAFGHVLGYGYGGDDAIYLQGGLAVPAFLFGGDGNDTLDASGSIANNVLAGGAGYDGLYSGSGRDVLIGGLGADTLRASSGGATLIGSDGAILIGGYTDYDANVQALLAIMKEWSRTDADYNTRVKHLNGTLSGGLSGSYRLTTTTVHDDNAVDSLYGGAGLDWFFARKKGANKDKVYNLSIGEVVTDLS